MAAADEEKLIVPSLFRVHESKDPFVWFVSGLHDVLSKEEEICNGPKFTSLASITEEQALGFGALFIARDSNFLCPLCHQVVDHLRPKVLDANPLIHADDEVLFRQIVSDHMPSTKAICSTALPACYQDYHINLPFNITNPALQCAACGGCMSATTILEHKFLLDEKAVRAVSRILNETIFYNVCASMCPNATQGVFSHFTFQGCMNTMDDIYNFAIKALQRIAMPNHLCSLELGFCENNATPNLLHCLPSLCENIGLLQKLLGDLCTKAKTDLPEQFLERFNIPAGEYEKTLQRMRIFDEL